MTNYVPSLPRATKTYTCCFRGSPSKRTPKGHTQRQASNNYIPCRRCVARTDLGFGFSYIRRARFGHPCKEPEAFCLIFCFVRVFGSMRKFQIPSLRRIEFGGKLLRIACSDRSFKKSHIVLIFSTYFCSLQWLWWIRGQQRIKQLQYHLEQVQTFPWQTNRFLHHFRLSVCTICPTIINLHIESSQKLWDLHIQHQSNHHEHLSIQHFAITMLPGYGNHANICKPLHLTIPANLQLNNWWRSRDPFLGLQKEITHCFNNIFMSGHSPTKKMIKTKRVKLKFLLTLFCSKSF